MSKNKKEKRKELIQARKNVIKHKENQAKKLSFWIGIFAIIFVFVLLLLDPIKETLICSGTRCTIQSNYLFRPPSIKEIDKPEVHIIIHPGGYRCMRYYTLSPVFEGNYFSYFAAERDKNIIESRAEVKVIKYNILRAVFFFVTGVLIFLLLGKLTNKAGST